MESTYVIEESDGYRRRKIKRKKIANDPEELLKKSELKMKKKKRLKALLDKASDKNIQQPGQHLDVYQKQSRMNPPGWGNNMNPNMDSLTPGYEYHGMGDTDPSKLINKVKKSDNTGRETNKGKDSNYERKKPKKKRNISDEDSDEEFGKSKGFKKETDSSDESEYHRKKKHEKKKKKKLKQKKVVTDSSSDDETMEKLEHIEELKEKNSGCDKMSTSDDSNINMTDTSEKWLSKMKMDPAEFSKMDKF